MAVRKPFMRPQTRCRRVEGFFMRFGPFVAAAVLAGAALTPSAVAQVADGPARTFTGRDLFGLRVASDPQTRPDGGAIAYVRVTNDVMSDRGVRSIWLVDPASGAQSPLVAGEGSAFAPRWSPDGERLAYILAGEGGAQLYVRWMATGRTAKVATLEQSPNDLAWSPDGKSLVFTMLTRSDSPTLGAPLRRPEGAKWAEPLQVIDRVSYRADGEGLLKPGYQHVFTVSAD